MKLIIRDNIINGKVYHSNVLYGGEGDDRQLIIPNHVEAIAEEAFGYRDVNPNIKELIFEPNGHVEIGYSAFADSNLEKIDFSNSVERILAAAFEKCSFLKDIRFGEGLKVIESRAFLDDIKIEAIELPAGLQVIESQAFQGCKALKRVLIPDSVNEIGNGAFNQCNSLKELQCSTENLDRFLGSFNAKNKPDKVVDYLDGTFTCISEPGEKTIAYIRKNQKKLIDIIIEKDNDVAMGALLGLSVQIDEKVLSSAIKSAKVKVRAILINNQNKTSEPAHEKELLYTDKTEKPKTAAEWKKEYVIRNKDNNELELGAYKGEETRIILPGMIGKRKVTETKQTFYNNQAITDVLFSETIVKIGFGTFNGCTELKSVHLNDGLQIIGPHAFEGCKQLTEITIPSNVVEIDGNAFADCSSLSRITIPDSVVVLKTELMKDYFDGHVFRGCTNLKEVVLPSKIKYISEGMFVDCISLKSITIPDSVECIERHAFYGCQNLETISIPESVIEIEPYAFGECGKLRILTKEGCYADRYAKENGIAVDYIS